jgi:type IV secretion system protein VirD4
MEMTKKQPSDRPEPSRGRIRDPGRLMGEQVPTSPPFGFAQTQRMPRRKLIRCKGEGHCITIAGTGTGKGVGALIPNALMHDGQLIVLDVSGEITSVCARRRREIGDQVVVIDPFNTTSASTDSMNPMDMMLLSGTGPEEAAETLASLLGIGHESTRDTYWTTTSRALLAGLLADAGGSEFEHERTLNHVVEVAGAGELDYDLAVRLDKGAVHNEFASMRYREYLSIPEGSSAGTRSCVLSTMRQMLHPFQSGAVRKCLHPSSFRVADLLAGEAPLSIFIVLPFNRLTAYKGLMRMWVSAIMSVLSSRTRIPQRRTLLLIDETAQMGTLEQLPSMYAYLRGVGVNIWTFWQSLEQLSACYTTTWRSMVENSAAIQTFGLARPSLAAMANLLEVPRKTLEDLGGGRLLLTTNGQDPTTLARIDYRTHRLFRGMFDPNPRYLNNPRGPMPGSDPGCTM